MFCSVHSTENYFWLGLQQPNGTGDFVSQITQNPLNFTLWDASQPDAHSSSIPHDVCVTIDLAYYNGKWADRYCSTHQYAVVCETEYV